MNPDDMTLDERNYFGFEPADHVVRYYERKRLERIARAHQAAAMRHATGIRFSGRVVSFA